MRIVWIILLIFYCDAIFTQEFGGIFPALDLDFLDEYQYCQVNFGSLAHDEGYLPNEMVASDSFSSYTVSWQNCNHSLIVKPFSHLVTHPSASDSTCAMADSYFVKDFGVTYLFWSKGGYGLYGTELDFQTVACKLPRQPYFFLLMEFDDTATMFEVQVFTKLWKVVYILTKNPSWSVDPASMRDLYQRRSDFNGLTLRVVMTNTLPFGLIDKKAPALQQGR